MKKLIIILFTLILFSAYSQDNLAKMKYLAAEEEFEKENYDITISNLIEAENILGSTNPKILFLKIISQEKILEKSSFGDLEMIADLKNNCKKYLTDYSKNENLVEKYKEVYRISESIKKYSINDQLISATKKGDINSLFLLGEEYYKIQNFKKSLECYDKAAAKGHARSMFRIGEIYAYAFDVQFNFELALDWFQKAQLKNDILATYEIARLYDRGEGTKKDTAKATELFIKVFPEIKKLAESGDELGIHYLGRLYYTGRGGQQSYTKAIGCFKEGAEKNLPSSMFYMGLSYQYGDGIERNLTTAFEWFKKAAERKHTYSMTKTGDCYFYEQGAPINFKYEAISWYTKASELGHLEATHKLGSFYEWEAKTYSNIANTSDAIKSTEKSVMHYLKAAEKNYTPSYYALANHYNKNVQYTKAKEWYLKCIEETTDIYFAGKSMKELGDLYYWGRGVTQSYSIAMEWYLKAAEKYNKEAMQKIGFMYSKGKGVKKDKEQASIWYQRSFIK